MRYLGSETVPRTDLPSVVQKWLDRWEANGSGTSPSSAREDARFLGRVGMIVWDVRSWRHVTLADVAASVPCVIGSEERAESGTWHGMDLLSARLEC